MNTQEEEWVGSFEGKDEQGIFDLPLPEGLSDEDCFRFRSLQQEAMAAARESAQRTRENAVLQRAEVELAAAGQLQVQTVAEDCGRQPEGGRQIVPPAPLLPFAIPYGSTDKLLDKQIASCAGIIEHLAHYIGRYDSAVETCNQFMDRISLMMRSSAEAAIAVGRLRGMAPEGRRRR